MRRALAVLIGLAVVGAGVMLAAAALGGRGDLAAVGRVVCAREGVRVVTPDVAAGANGLHLEVVNVGAERRYEIASPMDPGSRTVGGILPEDGLVDLRLTLAPGEWEFACLRAGTGERLAADFELHDPRGLWRSDALACADPDSGVFETEYVIEPFEATARRALPGLAPADVVVKPGYPQTAWHGELHVVIRDEEVVGRVVRVLNHGTWNLIVDACPGSRLTQGAVVETGAT